MSDDWDDRAPSSGGPRADLGVPFPVGSGGGSRVTRVSPGSEILVGLLLTLSALIGLAELLGADPDGAVGVVGAFVPDLLVRGVIDAPVVPALIGYAMTPFGVVLALAWARTAGLQRLDDPWFDASTWRQQVRRLQIAALLSFLVAGPHVLVLARAIQAWWSGR